MVAIEQPEMSKWTVILLLVHHPLFDFNQTMVGPFDFMQYLLCLWVWFALCAVTRNFAASTYSRTRGNEAIFVRHSTSQFTKKTPCLSNKGPSALSGKVTLS